MARVGVVVKLACRCQMVGPSLSAGGERVIPHERRNSNGSALAVNDLQDDEISIVTYL